MKNLLTIIILSLSLSTSAQQKATKTSDGVYTITSSDKVGAIPTGDKLRTKDGELLSIFKTARGKYFVIRTSKKTGNQYNQYINLDK